MAEEIDGLRDVRAISVKVRNHTLWIRIDIRFEGRLKVFLDQTFALKDAAKAHRRIEERKSFGKIVLIP